MWKPLIPSFPYLIMVTMFILWGSIFSASGITIYNGSTDTNDRFDNDSNFVADSFDLSGVGINGNGRWLTMLSENVYISAEHYKPSAGSSVTFYEGNDPNGNSVTTTVSSTNKQIKTSDLYLGTIEDPLSSAYTYYDFATEDIDSSGAFSTSSYAGANAYVFGRSARNWPTSQDMAVGRNELDLFSEYNVNSNTGDAIGATDDGSSGVTYEAMLEKR